ncbi:toll/interleukin-1 receptor domain-containing protein [Trichlorobacter lovleyi]|uniref:toll/interleukin-1 receptor domain-containing protein n=1 Tax=Trichlorobacter lovleyi TaxID=313985 RepID=UPI00248124DE|nr:toll/interleukin-1 receptor domain-containing protein [Trichlorobacter lovleyi]
MTKSEEDTQLYDVFICHASEDKDAVVRGLADLLRQKHIEVWYDEFSLQIGDSIRRAIDKGLTRSRFGIVVLSEAFFQKEWPQYELDGLLVKETIGREKVILPVWHGVDYAYVAKYSLSLAGRLAANTTIGLKEVADQLSRVINPQSSPLVSARDHLLSFGVTPPVITDKRWLYVVEASNNMLPFGAVPDESSIWGRWSFPLPPKSDEPAAWGERLAWSYMQMQWVEDAEKNLVTPLTHHLEVQKFIHRNPGLFETCQDFPSLLVEWAPQLTIPGFEGDLLETIESAYQASCKKQNELAIKGSGSGAALTIDGTTPKCDEDFALRHPTFGGYDSVHIASAYFHGDMFGPTVSPYEDADHLFWLLSESSKWLPEATREILLDGIVSRSRWLWGSIQSDYGGEWRHCGDLLDAVHDLIGNKKEVLPKSAVFDLENRIALSIKLLDLPESIDAIKKSFLEHRVVERTIAGEFFVRKRRKKNQK